jgi:alpha-D-ribose 1-methylphosphonate 5-triphosphate synthase subunit PhnH
MTTTTAAPLSAAHSQLVFRAVMDALARPGTVHRLPGDAAAPPALLPVLALADLETPACVLADTDEWADVVRAMTSAPAARLARARLVAALRPVTSDELARLRTGTSAAPEDGALACLSVAGLTALADGDGPDGDSALDRRRLRLSGPGIPGTRDLLVAGLPPGFAAVRRDLTRGFPAGADLLLITPEGDLAGLPRTTLIESEGAS